MTHTPEKWYVGYDQEYDIDAGDDGRTICYPTGRDKFDGTIFMVAGEDQIEIIAEHIRDERTAHRIAALWNMAERLRLTTEEIENGKIDKALLKLEELELMIERGDLLNKAAPDMLRALEAVTGDSEESDYLTQARIYGMCRSAIRKARGEE